MSRPIGATPVYPGYTFGPFFAILKYMPQLLKTPSAWVPIALSLIALGTMLVFIAINGTPTRQPDEETGAHLFQIWFGLEFLMIVFFAFTWLPKRPKWALSVLMVQIVAVLAACAPVFYFKL